MAKDNARYSLPKTLRSATRLLAGALGALCLMVLDPGGLSAQATASPRPARVTVLDSLLIESTSQQPLVRPSGFAVLRGGAIVVSDLSEGNLRLHDRRGRLVQIVGRPGAGPGEFRAPVSPRTDTRNRVHVVDVGLLRISVFESDPRETGLRLLRTLSINGVVGAIFGFEVLANGDYLIAGVGGQREHVVFHTDSMGVLRQSYLRAPGQRREGQSEEARSLWGAITVSSLATDGHRFAFVVISTLDSLWRVDLADGSVERSHLMLPGYVPPSIPNPLPATRDAVRSWAYSQNLVAAVGAGDVLVIPYFKGRPYLEGVTSSALVRRANEPWRLLERVASVIAVRSDTLYTLPRIEEPIHLVRLRVEK